MDRLSTLSTSTKAGLPVTCLLVVGAWRHFETSSHIHSLQEEVWVQFLAWAFLFGVSRGIAQLDKSDETISHGLSLSKAEPLLWATGAAAIASQVLSSQYSLTWVLPLTTVAVTLLSHFAGNSAAKTTDKEGALLSPSAGALNLSDTHASAEHSQLYRPIILNVICFALLLNYQELLANHVAIFYSILFLATRATTVYGIGRLEPPAVHDQYDTPNPAIRKTVSQLSTRMLILLTVLLVIVRADIHALGSVHLIQAVAQSVWWFSLITLVRLQHANTATNLDTVAASGQLALAASDLRSIALAASAGLFAVGQSLFLSQTGAAVRRFVLFASVVFLLVLFLRQKPRLTGYPFAPNHPTSNSTAPSHTSPVLTAPATTKSPLAGPTVPVASPSTNTDDGFSHGHPIELLIEEKRTQFSKVLAKQSKSLQDAVKEYKHRYGRSPPAGFDRWFEIAKAHNFVLVDEFDTFMHKLEPFRGIHPDILKARLDEALGSRGFLDRTCVIHVKNKGVTYGGGDSGPCKAVMDEAWLDTILYDMTIIINHYDEPMVSALYGDVEKALEDAQTFARNHTYVDKEETQTLRFLDVSKQSAWSSTRGACSVGSPARANVCVRPASNAPLDFVSDLIASTDVCNNCAIKDEHAIIVNPDTLIFTSELTPIFSASRPSHFNDLLYPSYYYQATRHDYKLSMDSAWADKDNKFYWVGRATGGRATHDNWYKFQRQRLVLKTQAKNHNESVPLLEEAETGSNKWRYRNASMADVAEYFKIRMAGTPLQCEDNGCEEQNKAFDLGNDITDSKEEAYQHRFVLDIDGNGFSGRYYRLLRSHSAVVKSTILREWHDDWLFPWVHYIPLSIDYHELPEMARFLAGTQRGLELAERIAKESTDWSNAVLRDVDFKIVWLRLMLEYGRLFQPDRELAM